MLGALGPTGGMFIVPKFRVHLVYVSSFSFWLLRGPECHCFNHDLLTHARYVYDQYLYLSYYLYCTQRPSNALSKNLTTFSPFPHPVTWLTKPALGYLGSSSDGYFSARTQSSCHCTTSMRWNPSLYSRRVSVTRCLPMLAHVVLLKYVWNH